MPSTRGDENPVEKKGPASNKRRRGLKHGHTWGRDIRWGAARKNSKMNLRDIKGGGDSEKNAGVRKKDMGGKFDGLKSWLVQIGGLKKKELETAGFGES